MTFLCDLREEHCLVYLCTLEALEKVLIWILDVHLFMLFVVVIVIQAVCSLFIYGPY